MKIKLTAESVGVMCDDGYASITLARKIEDILRREEKANVKSYYSDEYRWTIEATVSQKRAVEVMLSIERCVKGHSDEK